MTIWINSTIGIVCLVAGLFALVRASREFMLALRSKSWPNAPGVVARTGINYDGDFHSADISYRYTVDGKDYVGHRVAFGMYSSFQSKQAAERYIKGNTEGQSIRVLYCPENPGLSVLRPGLNPHMFWLPSGGMLSVLIGVGMLWNVFKSLNQNIG